MLLHLASDFAGLEPLSVSCKWHVALLVKCGLKRGVFFYGFRIKSGLVVVPTGCSCKCYEPYRLISGWRDYDTNWYMHPRATRPCEIALGVCILLRLYLMMPSDRSAAGAQVFAETRAMASHRVCVCICACHYVCVCISVCVCRCVCLHEITSVYVLTDTRVQSIIYRGVPMHIHLYGAGVPCQPFAQSGKGKGQLDPRGRLFLKAGWSLKCRCAQPPLHPKP